MNQKKIFCIHHNYRPGAPVPVGDFFIIPESPGGSIFLLRGGEL
jgi:hypothetical protein